MDAQIGLILEKLKSQNLWDDTIVIFTSDHGYHLGEHFMWGKVTLFEECARVPLVVRVPGASQSGAISDGLVETIDLFPTLAELCDLIVPAHLQGQSFGSLIRKPDGLGKSAPTPLFPAGPNSADPSELSAGATLSGAKPRPPSCTILRVIRGSTPTWPSLPSTKISSGE